MGRILERCAHCGLVPLADKVRRPAHAVCESAAMQQLFRRAGRFARSDAPVVISGESGSGKEVVARVLHGNSARAERPFVAINVAALPDDLLESELFGHARGAFTGAGREKRGLFEEADGGTLFLDEIGEMPAQLQVKLLRALQDGEIRRVGDTKSFSVDTRILCATHRDLTALVRVERFRQDLFYRLKVLTLEVPPLRRRAADIMPLARQFLAAERTAADRFAEAAEAALLAHPWPGNVRELENAVRHGAALASGATIEREHLPDDVLERRAAVVAERVGTGELRALEEVERAHILGVLDACGGSVTEAARVLEIGRTTLWRKLKHYD